MRMRERLAMAAAILLAGCVGTDLVEDPVTTMPTRIAITPTSAAVQVSNTASFQATYYDSLRNPVAGATFQWTSLDPAIASIDASGLALGKLPGQTRIVAAARGISSEAALLTVVANTNQVARVMVTPDSGRINVGQMLQFTAVARNLNGEVIAGKTFSWQSSDATVATVSGAGLATALKGGRVNIVAATDGVESRPASLEIIGSSRSGTFTNKCAST